MFQVWQFASDGDQHWVKAFRWSRQVVSRALWQEGGALSMALRFGYDY